MKETFIKFKDFGESELGQRLNYISFSEKVEQAGVLILAAVHGDEVESIWLLQELTKSLFIQHPERIRQLSLIPIANPDGVLFHTRVNFNGVDLNRNLPTSNWSSVETNVRYPPGRSPASEKETKAFVGLVELLRPQVIVSLHSFSKSLVLAPRTTASGRFIHKFEELANDLNVPVVSEMDYRVFGSLTGFCREREIASITLELVRGLSREETVRMYLAPFESFILKLIASL